MDRIKRFIDISIPVQTCNLRCPYCYIAQNKMFLAALPYFRYNAETIGKALTQERLGGICHFNLCGGGETLLPPQMTDIIYAMLEQGHYIAVVTNGTVTQRFDEICEFPTEYLERLLFKFSFHYTELKRLNKFDVFWGNVRKMRAAGCSISVELTPSDEVIPFIDDIKEMCVREAGAYCHITVARDETDSSLPILTKLDRDEYYKTWNTFDSELFRFKMSTFYVKRKEFCYAGEWSATLNLGTGILRQCYCGKIIQNIFEDIDKPIKWQAIGKYCTEPHCHNSHVWLTLGDIPEISGGERDTPVYSLMRNRVCADGTEWLNPRMKEFLSTRLYESNSEFSEEEKKRVNRKMCVQSRVSTVMLGSFRWVRKHSPKKLRIYISNKIKKY